jgi:hypothetical protein
MRKGFLPLLLVPAGLLAQKTIELSGSPKCADCGVRLEQVALLGDMSQGPNRLDAGAYAIDKTRKLIYLRGSSRTEIAAWGMDGKVAFTVGIRERRPQAGALEQSFGLGAGDSLWVLDPVVQRVTVYAPGTGTSVRGFRPKFRVERIIPLKDGRFVGIASHGDKTDPALVHILSTDGQTNVDIPATAAPGSRPVVALAKNGSLLWVAHPDGYVIDGWSLDGKKTTTVRRIADWFSAESVAKAQKAHRTAPHIVNLAESEDGLLWLDVAKPDPTYKPATKKGAAPSGPDVVHVLEVLNLSAAKIEFADEVSVPLYRTAGDFLVQPDLHGNLARWRVVKAKFVKR